LQISPVPSEPSHDRDVANFMTQHNRFECFQLLFGGSELFSEDLGSISVFSAGNVLGYSTHW